MVQKRHLVPKQTQLNVHVPICSSTHHRTQETDVWETPLIVPLPTLLLHRWRRRWGVLYSSCSAQKYYIYQAKGEDKLRERTGRGSVNKAKLSNYSFSPSLRNCALSSDLTDSLDTKSVRAASHWTDLNQQQPNRKCRSKIGLQFSKSWPWNSTGYHELRPSLAEKKVITIHLDEATSWSLSCTFWTSRFADWVERKGS